MVISAVVPVTKMAGRLQNLKTWLQEANEVGMEIIIVHDYRDIDTQVELEAICSSFPTSRIFLHSGQFGSPGATRNFGLREATSKYVVFWDSDDLPKPRNLFAEVLKNEGRFDVLVGQYLINTQGEKSLDLDLNAFSFNPGLWRMVFLRDLIKDIEFDFMRMGEDQVFLGKCLKKLVRIRFTETLVYEYYLGVEGQLTGSKESKIELVEAFEEVVKLRESSEGNQYKYFSIVMIRMWLTLAKIGLIKAFHPEIVRRLFTKEIFISRRPLTQLKCWLYVCKKFIR